MGEARDFLNRLQVEKNTMKMVNEMKTPIAIVGTGQNDNIIIPNHSGDHSKGKVYTTPVNNYDLANKKYVDDNSGGFPEGTAVKSTGELITKYLRADGDGTSSWQVVTHPADAVTSVFTRTGAVVAAANDYTLDLIGNPAANKNFNMANKLITWTFTNPAGGILYNYTGAASGHLLEINQNTGNVAANTHLLHIEATDTDALPLHLRHNGAAGTETFKITNAADATMFAISNSGNVTLTGTVDGIDIATDVAANTLKATNVSTDLSLGTKTATTMDVNSSDGTNATLIEADTTNAGLLGSDKWDEIVANTAAKHTQGTDTALGSGAVAADHGTASTDQIVNVCYGTGAAPTANTTTIGSLYVTYTA